MKIRDLINRASMWLGDGPEDIIVSSRVRLARNVRGEMFPGKAEEADRIALWKRLNAILCALPGMESALSCEMSELTWSERHVLKERHLISVDQCEKGKGSGVVISSDEGVSVMVNEEDHLRIQSTFPGLNLDEAWSRSEAVECALEQRLEYAFSKKLGYLTACPSNVGTGLRAGVMLHLPGLSLLNELEQVVKGLTRIGFAVRGLLGEGTEASGNMFQVSNQTTLGENEQAIIDNLSDVVDELVEHEKNARLRLVEQRPFALKDCIGRSYGILQHARMLSSAEMLDLLSSLRLGLEVGVVRNLSAATICELMVLTQPGHMQIIADRELSPEDRDVMRADTARDRLKKVSLSL